DDFEGMIAAGRCRPVDVRHGELIELEQKTHIRVAPPRPRRHELAQQFADAGALRVQREVYELSVVEEIIALSTLHGLLHERGRREIIRLPRVVGKVRKYLVRSCDTLIG